MKPALFLFPLLFVPGLRGEEPAVPVVQLAGRLLEVATKAPVAGATVVWKSPSGNFSAVSDDEGGFLLSRRVLEKPAASVTGLLDLKNASMGRDGLRLRTLSPNVTVDASLHDVRGRSLYKASRRFETPGSHILPVPGNTAGSLVGFLKIKAGGESYLFKVARISGPVSPIHVKGPSGPALARASAERDTLEIRMPGFIRLRFYDTQAFGEPGEIFMYRAQAVQVAFSGNHDRISQGYFPRIPHQSRYSRQQK